MEEPIFESEAKTSINWEILFLALLQVFVLLVFLKAYSDTQDIRFLFTFIVFLIFPISYYLWLLFQEFYHRQINLYTNYLESYYFQNFLYKYIDLQTITSYSIQYSHNKIHGESKRINLYAGTKKVFSMKSYYYENFEDFEKIVVQKWPINHTKMLSFHLKEYWTAALSFILVMMLIIFTNIKTIIRATMPLSLNEYEHIESKIVDARLVVRKMGKGGNRRYLRIQTENLYQCIEPEIDVRYMLDWRYFTNKSNWSKNYLFVVEPNGEPCRNLLGLSIDGTWVLEPYDTYEKLQQKARNRLVLISIIVAILLYLVLFMLYKIKKHSGFEE